jgi:hypothetical protein
MTYSVFGTVYRLLHGAFGNCFGAFGDLEIPRCQLSERSTPFHVKNECLCEVTLSNPN